MTVHDMQIGARPIEETTVVHLGTTPGEQYGWECAGCQEVSGLQFGSHDEADQALAQHLEQER